MQSAHYITEYRRMLMDAKSVLSSSNWSDLPPDLLRLVYRKLYDTFDFIIFRAVCKGWLAAAPLSEHPPQFPFILERKNSRSSNFKLHSLHTGKTHRIQVPEVLNKKFCGQSHGYLVTYKTEDHDNSLTVLNPFTRAEVPLPFNGFHYFTPLHIGADPIRNSDDVVIYMINSGYEGQFVGFWKNEDNKWALQRTFVGCVETYLRGRLCCTNYKNNSTRMMDLTTRNKLEVKLPYNDFERSDFFCLGEGGSAILGIQRHINSGTKNEDMSLEKCWFEVYHIDEEVEPPRWIKLIDISDLIIFLNSDDNTGFCLSVSGFDGISGNCIYVLKMVIDGRSLIGLYKLGNDRTEVIGQLESKGTWIVPNVY